MSLTRLRGPADGMLELPITVQWGPPRIFDRPTPANDEWPTAPSSGTARPKFKKPFSTERCSCRNGQPILPRRCQTLWEQRFPELTTA